MASFFSFILAIVSFTISILSFAEKGFLFNNAYIFASEQERKVMNKKPYYRQSGIVFCLAGFLFLFIGIAALSGAGWLYGVIGAVGIATVAYAIISSVKQVTKSNKE